MDSDDGLKQELACTIERLNTHYSSEVLCIARFYGQCQQAQNARVCGLSDSELTIEWDVVDKGTHCMQSTSLAIAQSDSPMRQVLDKTENARIALKAMSTAIQQSGEMLPTPIEFLLPPQPIIVSVLGGLAMLLSLAFAQPSGLTGLVYWILPQWVFQLALYALAGVHCVEAMVMYLACRYVRRLTKEYELSASAQMQYTATTLVFGLFTGIMFVRQVMKPPSYVRE